MALLEEECFDVHSLMLSSRKDLTEVGVPADDVKKLVSWIDKQKEHGDRRDRQRLKGQPGQQEQPRQQA